MLPHLGLRVGERPHVLFTDVGHPVTPSTLESLHSQYFLIGVDCDQNAVGFAWVDKGYIVPPPDRPEYIPRLLDICRQERVNVVVPWTDAEVEVIAPAKAEFQAVGAALLSPSAGSVARLVDKGQMLLHLSAMGIETPRFYLASDSAEVARAAYELGYPSKSVVVKPRRSSGGRGLWFLNPTVDLSQRYPSSTITLESFLLLLQQREAASLEIPPYVVMEFLAGEDYSADVLARNGEILMTVPRRRINAIDGVSHTGEIHADERVIELATTLTRAFELDLCFNIQVRYRGEGAPAPLVYEVNPRVSGTVVASVATGVNMLDAAIRLTLGEHWTYPAYSLATVRLTRFWKEHYRTKGAEYA